MVDGPRSVRYCCNGPCVPPQIRRGYESVLLNEFGGLQRSWLLNATVLPSPAERCRAVGERDSEGRDKSSLQESVRPDAYAGKMRMWAER